MSEIMEKNGEEDNWGMQEYNTYRSFRFVNHNPDLAKIKFVICTCGTVIDTVREWYVMLANGLLLCRLCAVCHSCRIDSPSISKKLVCIDGMVLCHSCLENFGSNLEPPFVVKIRDPKNRINLDLLANANNVPGGFTPDILVEFKRKNRSQYVEKQDMRRTLRNIKYERAAARLPADRNPLITAPPYDAYRGRLEKMACPACSQPATKREKYVVAAMARIYHRKCFNCVSCKDTLTEGIKEAGKHYEYCSCEPPQVWCTKNDCRQHRIAHHASSVCWMGPLRPGGRKQHDTDLTAQWKRQQEREGKRDK